jgi:hypothetical protein
MGSGGNTTSTVTQQNIPEEFFPYFDRLLAQSENEMGKPYQPYQGERLAGTSADTTGSYNLVRDVAYRDTPGRDLASNVAAANVGRTGQIMGGAGPYQFSEYGGFTAGEAQPYAGFSETQVQPYSDFSAFGADPYANFREANFTGYEFGPAETMTAQTAQEYMDPYLRSVVDIEKEKAREDYEIAKAGRSSTAVGAGAFGGSRAQIAESMAERDLANRMRDIEATGLKSAYGEATRRFEADRAARADVEAKKAAEAARVQTGKAGEAGRVQGAEAAELGRIQGLSASEFARVQESQAAELARVQGISVQEASRIQAAEAAEIARTQGISIDEAARIQSAQASERARVQAGQASENRAAIQDQLTMMGFSAEQASLVADLEEQARTGDIQAAQLLETIGRAQEAKTQAGLDIDYEDYLRQQGYNKEQIGFMSSILQGLPLRDAGTITEQTPYNPVQQALGAGLAGLSLYRGFQ